VPPSFAAGRPDPGAPQGDPRRGEGFASGRSLATILAASLLLVALVPFLPLAILAWWGYHEDVDRIETEIRGANRHIAQLAGNYLDSLLRRIHAEISAHESSAAPSLPPAFSGVAWECVAGDGTVVKTQLDPARIGRLCGYGDLPGATGERPNLTAVGGWIDGAPPTVLVLGSASPSGGLTAVLDPVALHAELEAWTPVGVDRHLYVVEASGRVLFYSDLALSQQGFDLSANPPVSLFVGGGEGDLDYTSVVSGKKRIGTVRRLEGAAWGVIVSADVGSRLIGLRSRYTYFAWSIAFAFAAAMVILAAILRRLLRPVLDIDRALRDPNRDPHAPLDVHPATRRVREYDELVRAFDNLGAEFAVVERELVQAEKTSLLGQLSSGLAHEMGTPLNVITGNAEYLLRKTDGDDPAWPTLQLIVNQGQRIAAMIRRLLDVSRPSEARLVPVNLEPLIRQTLEIVPGLRRRIDVRCDLDTETPPVLADPKLLEHALMNLILNACQAMSEGGRLALITGRESAADDRNPFVAIAVTDTGCGIPADELPRIFEPFFSTKAPGEGTGLGLAIVDRIVRQHGGSVEVTSNWGRGTVVLLRLRAVLGDRGDSGRGSGEG
jgi:signal transduction histidine kinase